MSKIVTGKGTQREEVLEKNERRGGGVKDMEKCGVRTTQRRR